MRIADLVKDPWDTIALYTLSESQAEELLKHPGVIVRQGWFPARHRFPEHTHPVPQLLLITRGRLTHISGGMSYTQTPGDILIVPAGLKHTAIVGDEELEFFLVLKAE